ncbi:MAG TPA: hypothetical protein VHA15_06195 [Burkholderiales bacterium]|jgi:hypothetical protein|nr:hypothetical protein [Burkholderiales bacterium]
METDDAKPSDFLDITPLARRYGFCWDFRIARELGGWVRDETLIGSVLRAASDALMMRGARPATLHPLVFAMKALRAPGELAQHCRLALRLEIRQTEKPTLTLQLAG